MSEEKLPFYKRYPKDYLSDENVAMMTLEQEGAYNRLMDYCWLQGSIPDDVESLARLCRIGQEKMGELWPQIRRCFVEMDGGRLTHPRLDRERVRAERKKQKLSEAGKRGARKRWAKQGRENPEKSSDAEKGPQSREENRVANGEANGVDMATHWHSQKAEGRYRRQKADTLDTKGEGGSGVTGQATKARPPSRSPPAPPTDQPTSEQNGDNTTTDLDGPVDRLRAYLDGRPVVDRIASKVRSADRWAMAIMGLYGPRGTKERLMGRIPEDERPLAIATALLRFEGEGQDWNGKFFAGIIRKVVGEFARGDSMAPDHGDETERDRQRASRARTRSAQSVADELRQKEEQADRAKEEAWAWYRALGDESEQRRDVHGDADKRVEVMRSSGVPISDTSRRMALLEAIRKHMPKDGGEAVA